MMIAETKIGKDNKIDFRDYKKQVDSLKNYSAVKKIVERLLENVKETARENKIENIVYHGSFYNEKKS